MEEPSYYAGRFEGLSGNAIREIFKLLDNPAIISFAGGNPAPGTFPSDALSQIASNLLQTNGNVLLQYGKTEGYDALKESVLPFLQKLGVTTDASHVLPVSGGQQAVDLMCKTLIDPGDTILVEEPTFLGAMHTMRLYQAKLQPLLTDDDGVIPEALEEAIRRHKPKFVYLIPTFQNPTGRTLTLARRKAVADIAARTGVFILEDDPYRDLRYRGDDLPAIKQFDTADRIIHVASFSKIISPGLRVAVVTAGSEILRKLVIGKQGTDVHSPLITQALVDAFLRKGLLDTQIERCKSYYHAQYEAMLSALEAFPEGTRFTRPDGGIFIWVELDTRINALQMLKQAVEHNVAYVPGTHFFCSGGHENTLRLNFSNASAAQIEKGMAALCEVIRRQ